MLLIKVSEFYFCGEFEGDAIFSYNKEIATRFETLEELDKIIEKYQINGYAVGVE